MKAKKYRLETVLGIRSRAREEAARLVALRLQQLETAEEELARRQRKLQACYEQQNKAQNLLNEELQRGIQARGILAHQNYLNDLRQTPQESLPGCTLPHLLNMLHSNTSDESIYLPFQE